MPITHCVQALLDTALELCGRYIQPYHTQEAAATVILQVCETGVAEGLALPENMVSQIQAVLGPNLRPAVRPIAPFALSTLKAATASLDGHGMAQTLPCRPRVQLATVPTTGLQQHRGVLPERGPLAGG